MLSRVKLEMELIKAWKPCFDLYPTLKALPIYSWGRYYKYESAGSAFENYVDEYGFPISGVENKIDCILIKKIEEELNQQGGKMWNGEIGDYLVDRVDAVRIYRFDDRAGKVLVIIKNGEDDFSIEAWDCDSPE